MLHDDYTRRRLKDLLDEVSNILDLKQPITFGEYGVQQVDKKHGVEGLVKKAFDVVGYGRNKIDRIRNNGSYWAIDWSKRDGEAT